MRSARFGLLLSVLLLSIPVWPRQTQTPTPSPQGQTTTTPPPVTKDAQAVDVVTQALALAGGSAAITTITDYTATGNVTYYLDVDRDVQGSVTVRGRGLNQFRLDANLPLGVRSEVTDGLTTIKTEDGSVQQLHTQSPLDPARLAMPYLQLDSALKSRGRSLLYKGIVNVDDHPAHEIQVQHFLGGAPGQSPEMISYLTVDFFVDASTFQIVMMQDVLPKHLVRQFRYTDFNVVNGVSVPFSISARTNDQDMWLINIGGIKFNSGLQDSDFQL
jgi:hypothetical protein